MAVTLFCILFGALAVTVVVAFALRAWSRQQARVDALGRERQARDAALESLINNTLPSIVHSLTNPGVAVEALSVSPALQKSRYAYQLQQIADVFAGSLRQLQAETHTAAVKAGEDQARQAVDAAEAAARAASEKVAREVTSAAVRSFSTSVVSLGADVSQVVSAALREHREDVVYETLTRIDHSVQQMIRQAQSYVIVCGGLPGRRWPTQSLTDVAGGAAGRVRDFVRVRAGQLDRRVISRAVEPLVHTMASLLDNALRYSPPTAFVDVNFQEGHHGVTVIIDDAGVRMNAEQMEEARQVLSGERVVDIHQLGPAPKIGFPGVAALARRYGFDVYVDGPNAYGGMRAMIYIPEPLLVPQSAQEPEPGPTAREQVPSAASGAVDDVTVSGLPRRRRRLPIPAPAPEDSPPAFTSGSADVATAWHSGSLSGRSAAANHTEG
jgi:hypothetical protein